MKIGKVHFKIIFDHFTFANRHCQPHQNKIFTITTGQLVTQPNSLIKNFSLIGSLQFLIKIKGNTIMPYQKYQGIIDACNKCAVACLHCASSCLQEDDVKMLARCILLDQQCADICQMTARMMARDSDFAESVLQICAEICEACGEECRQHEHMEHCQQCAKACYECAEICHNAASSRATM